MGTSSHARALLAQAGKYPRFAGHGAAVAGVLREALCTSPTKITAVPMPHWQRSLPSGMHILAPQHSASAHLMDWLAFLVIVGGSHSSRGNSCVGEGEGV